jgi:hypothetical protein
VFRKFGPLAYFLLRNDSLCWVNRCLNQTTDNAVQYYTAFMHLGQVIIRFRVQFGINSHECDFQVKGRKLNQPKFQKSFF